MQATACGEFCWTSGKYREAIECFKNSLGIFQEKGDLKRIAYCYFSLGKCYVMLNMYSEALTNYKQTLHIYQEIDDQEKIGFCYIKLGDCYLILSKYSEAVMNYEKSLPIIINLKMPKGLEGKVCLKLGSSCFIQLNRHQDAKKYLDKALIIAKEIGEGEMEWSCNISLSSLFYKQSQYREALEYAERALKIAKARNNTEEIKKTCGVLGKALAPLGRTKEAIDYEEQYLECTKQVVNRKAEAHALVSYAMKSVAISKETNDLKIEASAYNVIGIALCEKGKVKEAMEYHIKELHIATQTGDKLAEAKANCQLGLVFMKLSKHYDAIRYLKTCIKLNSELGCENANNAPYNNLGIIYTKVGKYHEAVEFFQQSLNISKHTGEIYSEIRVYQNISVVCSELNIAREYQWKSIILAIRIEEKSGKMSYFVELGKCFSNIAQFSESITNHKKALRLALNIKDSDYIGHNYLNIGDTYCQFGKMSKAISFYEKALQNFTESRNKQQQTHCHVKIGFFYYHLAQNQKICNDNVKYAQNIAMSEKYLRGSIHCSEEAFDDLREKHQLKISILDTYAFAYKQLALLLIETNRTGEALLVCESGRACALKDTLVSKYGMQQRHVFVENMTKRKPLNESDLTDLLPKESCLLFYSIINSSEKLCMWVVSQQQSSIHAQLEMEENSIAKNDIYQLADSAYQSIHVSQKAANCEDRSLGKQEPCNSEGDDYPLQLINSFAQMTLKQEIIKNELLKSSISRSPPESTSTDSDQQYHTKEPLKELFKQLITPVQEHLTQDEVIIIPDGPMYRVSFAALQDPQTGRFLCETKRIRLAPSLTTLKILKECSDDNHSEKGDLVIGNPRVGEVMFRGEKKKITRLPAAGREARVISDILSDILKVSTLIGEATTKDAVKEKLHEDAAVIHIAAHGDDASGEIALAPGISAKSKAIPDEEDYILRMQEVQEIGVRAKLVVLSCCHSGRGEIRAEGVVGMARAFLAAGARSVVASLWNIDDKATLDFMRHFYIQLKLGKSASVSLNKSMKKMIEGQRYNHPKYWAPFFLIGDDVTIY